jgi:hypothetical protein
MKTGVALALIGVGLLCVEQAAAQRGGRGGGQVPPEIMPNTDKETMILSLPEEWYPTQPLGNDNMTDSYLFPVGQDHAGWTETLRQEVFNTTAGIEAAERVYELRSASNQESCAVYTSRIRDDGPENGYSMIFWEQLCELGEEETIASLHKVVLGNDQLYILSKIWKYDPPNGTWRDWRNYFEDVYVCDPNRPEHPCRPMQLPPRDGQGGR